MATTTAQITLSSSDLLTDQLDLTTTATLYDAGTTTGVTQALCPARKTTTATDVVTLFNAAPHTAYGANKAHKVYVKNCSTTRSEYLTVTINAEEIGRLYAGDWMFIPWSAEDSGADVKVTPSVSSAMKLEYVLVHE